MNYKLLKKELEKDNFNELIKYIDKNFGDNDSYDEIITSLENLFNLLLEINYVPNTRFCELLIEQSEKIKKIMETIYLEKRKEIKQKKHINLLLKTYIDYKNEKSSQLTRKEECELFDRYHNGDIEALNILIERNQGLVKKCASRISSDEFDFDDLVQEGNLGLLLAIEKYETSKGNKFSTYAQMYIKKSIIRAIHNKSKNIRYPVHLYYEIEKLKKAQENLLKQGKPLTIENISKESELSIKKVKFILSLPTSISLSLKETNKKSGETFELQDVLPSEDNIEDIIIDKDLKKQLLRTIYIARLSENLTQREEEIVLLRNGYYGEIRSQEIVAKHYHVTKERIGQLERKAYKKLKRASIYTSLISYINDESCSAINTYNYAEDKIKLSASGIIIDIESLEKTIEILTQVEKEVLLLNLNQRKIYSISQISNGLKITYKEALELSKKVLDAYKEQLQKKNICTKTLKINKKKK
ncbi:MAG: sigma-70 family RNA polymerase sigma factor [Bacilli bacterium]|nr:sigma-70 family RNA polymerase sigma factor [Bacilli bacterium]